MLPTTLNFKARRFFIVFIRKLRVSFKFRWIAFYQKVLPTISEFCFLKFVESYAEETAVNLCEQCFRDIKYQPQACICSMKSNVKWVEKKWFLVSSEPSDVLYCWKLYGVLINNNKKFLMSSIMFFLVSYRSNYKKAVFIGKQELIFPFLQ